MCSILIDSNGGIDHEGDASALDDRWGDDVIIIVPPPPLSAAIDGDT